MSSNKEISPNEKEKIMQLHYEIIDDDAKHHSKEIKTILSQINLDERIILKYLSSIMKITP